MRRHWLLVVMVSAGLCLSLVVPGAVSGDDRSTGPTGIDSQGLGLTGAGMTIGSCPATVARPENAEKSVWTFVHERIGFLGKTPARNSSRTPPSISSAGIKPVRVERVWFNF